ncbi:MAG: DNA polymerase III subunit delta, partial [Variovorax paradoxus]|nr:DNA polymerase III subunit delta [Variovorax paradoxus]
AHVVDGICKGLKQPDWPAGGWQALQRLALMLCRACSTGPAPSPSGRGLG